MYRQAQCFQFDTALKRFEERWALFGGGRFRKYKAGVGQQCFLEIRDSGYSNFGEITETICMQGCHSRRRQIGQTAHSVIEYREGHFWHTGYIQLETLETIEQLGQKGFGDY